MNYIKPCDPITLLTIKDLATAFELRDQGFEVRAIARLFDVKPQYMSMAMTRARRYGFAAWW